MTPSVRCCSGLSPSLLAVALLGATQPGTAFGAAAEGRSLAVHFECNRCHELEGIEPASRERACVRCHDEILAGRFDAPEPSLARWAGRLKSLPAAPALTEVGERLRRDWLIEFLLEPADLRPRLPATMPRFDMTRKQAGALADFLGAAEPAEEEEAIGGDPQRGRVLVERSACITCHAFSGIELGGGSPLPVEPKTGRHSDAVLLAPDLRATRARYRPAALVRFLIDPTALPGSLMPKFDFSEQDARDVAAFVLNAPLEAISAPAAPRPGPPLGRAVRHSEVDRRVFHKVCRHCHGDPRSTHGNTGPGNAGGFGFPGRGLNVETYKGLIAGSRDASGRRRSVFRKTADGTPLLVAVLLARHAEVAGEPIPGLRGMPMGLPPLPMEDIQLVATWVAQGHRR